MSEKTLIQPAITGYHQLSQAEADLMNEIKAAGLHYQELCDKVGAHVEAQYAATATVGDVITQEEGDSRRAELARLEVADPRRWQIWARDGMQSCLMHLTRAVAQPSTF